MSLQNTYETIEAYLNGTLSAVDSKEFEQRLESDQELLEQLRLFQNINTAVKDKPLLNFQDIVRSEGEAFLAKETSGAALVRPINWPRRLLGIAASLLVLLASIFLIWKMQPGPLSGEELYVQNFETYPLNQSINRSGEEGPSKFKSGVTQYQAENFVLAAQAFQELAIANDQDMVLAFCLANTYLNLNPPKFDSAEQQFQKIIEDGASIYVPKAQWYLALILLQKEDLKQAEGLLQEVAKSGDQFGVQAKALLKELE